MLSKLLYLLAGLVVAYGLILLFMWRCQRALMYAPDRATPTLAAYGAEDMRIIPLVAEDGQAIYGWYAPPRDADKPVMFYTHGNAGHIGDRVYKARHWIDAGYGFFLLEYRAYGGNDGLPSEAGLYADARAGIAWLAQQGIGPRRLVLYGESLGTGIAVEMALEAAQKGLPVYGVVLEAPYTSLPAIAKGIYPWLPVDLLMKDRYASIEKIASINTPLLIYHGTEDTTVPMRYGLELFDAAKEPKTMLRFEYGTHINLYQRGAVVGIRHFLEGLS